MTNDEIDLSQYKIPTKADDLRDAWQHILDDCATLPYRDDIDEKYDHYVDHFTNFLQGFIDGALSVEPDMDVTEVQNARDSVVNFLSNYNTNG